MTRSISVKQSGNFSEVVQAYVKSGGVWVSPTAIYVNVSGNWTQCYPAESGSYIYNTPGTYNSVVPSGITSVTISVYGAGGGGGSGWFCGNAINGGSGGSGGYLQNQTVTVTPGEVVSVVVGAGGAGGVYPGFCGGSNIGVAGGSSSASGTYGSVSATGGGEGGGANSGSYPGAAGSPSGVAGNPGFNNCGGNPAGGINGTGYGTGGYTTCNASGGVGDSGAVIISWTAPT